MASKKKLPILLFLAIAFVACVVVFRGAQAQTGQPNSSNQPSVLYSILDPKFNLVAGTYPVSYTHLANCQHNEV